MHQKLTLSVFRSLEQASESTALMKTESVKESVFPRQLADRCDCFLAGSDQIWNPAWANSLYENMFLTFARPEQKIAYAPSFGVDHVSAKWEDRYAEALKDTSYNPLLLICLFILDFLCLHPFNDGNGRMSRLLTLLLLYRAGYDVGKYISLEKLIEGSKETYYEALQYSSENWHDGRNDYLPFVRYMLGIILSAYRVFYDRVQVVTENGLSKPDKVRKTIKDTLGTITKTEIVKKHPDISQVTIQRALNDLVKSGEIIKIGGGRYTSYTWNRERE